MAMRIAANRERGDSRHPDFKGLHFSWKIFLEGSSGIPEKIPETAAAFSSVLPKPPLAKPPFPIFHLFCFVSRWPSARSAFFSLSFVGWLHFAVFFFPCVLLSLPGVDPHVPDILWIELWGKLGWLALSGMDLGAYGHFLTPIAMQRFKLGGACGDKEVSEAFSQHAGDSLTIGTKIIAGHIICFRQSPSTPKCLQYKNKSCEELIRKNYKKYFSALIQNLATLVGFCAISTPQQIPAKVTKKNTTKKREGN